jgi:hypothetical protein
MTYSGMATSIYIAAQFRVNQWNGVYVHFLTVKLMDNSHLLKFNESAL